MPLKGLRDELCTWTVCVHLSFDFPHFVSLHKAAVLYEQSYICSLNVPTSENPCDRRWLLRHWFSFLCCSESCQLLLIKQKPRQYSDTAGLTLLTKSRPLKRVMQGAFTFSCYCCQNSLKKKIVAIIFQSITRNHVHSKLTKITKIPVRNQLDSPTYFPKGQVDPLTVGPFFQPRTPVKLSRDHREVVKEEPSPYNIKTGAERRFQGGRVSAFNHISYNYDSMGDINERRSTLLWRVEGTHTHAPANSQLLWNVSLH